MKKLLAKILPPLFGQYFNFLAIFSSKKAGKVTFNVFATVRKGRVKENQRVFLDEAKMELANVAGHQIQSYSWEGSKGPILLLHGWESNTFRWRNLIKKLRQNDFNIVAIDGPAHGYSSGDKLYVPLYSECTQYFIDKYKPKAVVGHSIGGMNILYNQYKKPDDALEKIVTIGSPCQFSLIANEYKKTLGFNSKVMQALDVYVNREFGLWIDEFSSVNFVQNNSKKGLLFHDEEDKTISVSESILVNKHWKGSQLITTRGLGHSMHQDEVNNQIIEFLES